MLLHLLALRNLLKGALLVVRMLVVVVVLVRFLTGSWGRGMVRGLLATAALGHHFGRLDLLSVHGLEAVILMVPVVGGLSMLTVGLRLLLVDRGRHLRDEGRAVLLLVARGHHRHGNFLREFLLRRSCRTASVKVAATAALGLRRSHVSGEGGGLVVNGGLFKSIFGLTVASAAALVGASGANCRAATVRNLDWLLGLRQRLIHHWVVLKTFLLGRLFQVVDEPLLDVEVLLIVIQLELQLLKLLELRGEVPRLHLREEAAKGLLQGAKAGVGRDQVAEPL